MIQKLCDSEFKVMDILWDNEPIAAKHICTIAAEKIGWCRNTTYTIIANLANKGYIKRTEPGFVCSSSVTRDYIQQETAKALLAKLFNGSRVTLLSALLEGETLTDEERLELRKIIG